MDGEQKKGVGKRNSWRDSIRGAFLGGDGGGERPSGLSDKKAERADKNDKAADDLKSAEKGAEDNKKSDDSKDNLADARQDEEAARGYYSGDGGRDKEKKTKGKLSLRRKGPILAIILSVFGIGGLMGATQFFQPFSLLAQFQETFNSMHISANARSEVFFRMQMDSGRVKNPIKGKWTIFGGETFKITSKQQSKLAMQGIEYDGDYNGTGTRILKYKNEAGEVKIVTADVATANKLGNGAVDFKTLYATDNRFFTTYNNGSMSWRGQIANWFESATSKITRNLFKDFQQKVAQSDGKSSRVVALDMMSQRAKTITDGGVRVREADERELEDILDENGNKVDQKERWFKFKAEDKSQNYSTDKTRADFEDGDVTTSSGVIDRSKMDNQAVRTKLNDIASRVQKGANMACTVMNVIGAVSLLVTASEALQIINLTTAYFEVIDKAKAGDGTDTPINDLMNALNEKKKNEHVVLASSGTGWSSNQKSNFGNDGLKTLTTETTTTEKTAIESSGIASFYGGNPVNPKDPSVQSFNFTGSIKRVLGGLGTSMAAFETCAIAKITANTATALTDAVEVAGCILGAVGAVFTFGVSATACGPLVIKAATGIALSVAIGVTVAGVIASISPVIAQMMTRDLITDLGGEDLGNALTSGANMYLGNAHRANGGSLSNTDKYIEFAIAEKQVIAEDAKNERLTKSPFDITSKYTFMGTILTQMMSFLSVNSLMSAVTSTSSVVSSSIVALDPSVSAYEIVDVLPDMKEYEETCPYLASIGAIGDAYCNPYAITDMSTIEYDPASDVIEKLADENSFLDESTSDGNVIVNGDSDLAKYILYCDNRTSAFGIADQNIVNAVSSWGSVQTGSSTFNNVANSTIGAVPVFGDIVDIVSNQQALDNSGYISGESCVAGNNVSASASPDWETSKYYQRFIEDQSLAESMGVIEESAVAAFLDDYYEKNPLDNSYEGMLARYSGLEKETVVAILDLVEYGNYIANYHPEERYAFGSPVVETENELRFDEENEIASVYVLLLNQISFADVRNRTWTV